MREEITNADLCIIGAGIAGLSLAFEAMRQGLQTVIIDDGRQGATHAATGLLAPRPDYMLRDIELVQVSDRECLRWANLFPKLVSPKRFLIPIYPNHRRRFGYIESFLKKYDRVTPSKRSLNILSSSRISQAELEILEPNIRKNYFDGALSLWELTADPDELLRRLDESNRNSPLYSHFVVNAESLRFQPVGSAIYKVTAITLSGQNIAIQGGDNFMSVVNAAGPWIQDIVAPLGINLNIVLRLGIQMAVSGHFFQSAIIPLNKVSKGCICLPRKNFLQVGPTNTLFTGHPDNITIPPKEMGRLLSTLKSLLDPDIRIGKYDFLKAGLRVKPRYGDTNRPIIWSHSKDGFENLYTLFPGKMSLGLLAADEMLATLATDGWVRSNSNSVPKHALDGNREFLNWLFLNKERVRSLVEIGTSIFLS